MGNSGIGQRGGPITISTTMDVPAAVAEVRREIHAACRLVGRNPDGVRLIAVTKNQDASVLPLLAAAGITDIGENRIEHHQTMLGHARKLHLAIHAIGRIQGRQLAELAPISDSLHSLADPGHLDRLARACSGRMQPLPVFLQVNTSGEPQKAGVDPEKLADFLAQARCHPDRFTVVGLMTMAEHEAGESAIRSTFRSLRHLAEQHELPRLSMGMSEDFRVAVEEGATEVRIGTRLFAP